MKQIYGHGKNEKEREDFGLGALAQQRENSGSGNPELALILPFNGF